MKIGTKIIGRTATPFTIAEAGINHNGNIELAFKMIAVAKASGADAIKFQTFKAKEFIADPSLEFTYQSQGKPVTESMQKMFERYEFSKEQWHSLKRECEKLNITFLSTPQNESDFKLLMEIGVPAIKIGSDDFTNLPLISQYRKSQLPILISCGMANLEEVSATLKTLGTAEGYPTVLLLCTSEYPTPPEHVNLKKLETLGATFPKVVLGFSDHTQGTIASSTAVAFGATVFEKHFTLDQNLPGPDHWFSENPESLKEWVAAIHTAHKMLGKKEIEPTLEERKMRTLARRSVVALCPIRKGEYFTPLNIGLRRPGDGLAPKYLPAVLGQMATRDIDPLEKLKVEDYE